MREGCEKLYEQKERIKVLSVCSVRVVPPAFNKALRFLDARKLDFQLANRANATHIVRRDSHIAACAKLEINAM
jgi:tRNA G18 (ribose-2'-O)-methylase SpoU